MDHIAFTKESLTTLIADIYVAGFCDGRKTAQNPFDTDVVLSSAFKLADQTADNLGGDPAKKVADIIAKLPKFATEQENLEDYWNVKKDTDDTKSL
jgi:hypothetical protein